jgi:hypothetical protein
VDQLGKFIAKQRRFASFEALLNAARIANRFVSKTDLLEVMQSISKYNLFKSQSDVKRNELVDLVFTTHNGAVKTLLVHFAALHDERRQFAAMKELTLAVRSSSAALLNQQQHVLKFLNAEAQSNKYDSFVIQAIRIGQAELDRLFIDTGAGLHTMEIIQEMHGNGRRVSSMPVLINAVAQLYEERAVAMRVEFEHAIKLLGSYLSDNTTLFSSGQTITSNDIHRLLAGGGGLGPCLNHIKCVDGVQVFASVDELVRCVQRRERGRVAADAGGDNMMSLVTLEDVKEVSRFLQNTTLLRPVTGSLTISSKDLSELLEAGGSLVATLSQLRYLDSRNNTYTSMQSLRNVVAKLGVRATEMKRELQAFFCSYDCKLFSSSYGGDDDGDAEDANNGAYSENQSLQPFHIDRLFERGLAGAETLAIVKKLNVQGKRFAGFDELIVSVSVEHKMRMRKRKQKEDALRNNVVTSLRPLCANKFVVSKQDFSRLFRACDGGNNVLRLLKKFAQDGLRFQSFEQCAARIVKTYKDEKKQAV